MHPRYRECDAAYTAPVVELQRAGGWSTIVLWLLRCERPRGHAGGHVTFTTGRSGVAGARSAGSRPA